MTTPTKTEATAKPYYELLRDSRWQRKRLEIMERDGFACTKCGAGEDDGTTLNVHHAYYTKGLKPWEYPDDVLFTFCEDCHSHLHSVKNDLLLAMCLLNAHDLNSLVTISSYNEVLERLDDGYPFPVTAVLACLDLSDKAYGLGHRRGYQACQVESVINEEGE